MTTSSKVQYSGFFRRFGAVLLDLHFLPLIIVILSIYGILDKDMFFWNTLIALPLYTICTQYLFGATLGKWVLGIEIKTEDLSRPALVKLARRELILKPVQILFFGIGLWSMFQSKKKQTLYDKRLHLVIVQWRRNWIGPLFLFLTVLYLVVAIITSTVYPLSF
jgi:uncharacterized RDD family membrane protein YckC